MIHTGHLGSVAASLGRQALSLQRPFYPALLHRLCTLKILKLQAQAHLEHGVWVARPGAERRAWPGALNPGVEPTPFEDSGRATRTFSPVPPPQASVPGGTPWSGAKGVARRPQPRGRT